MEEQNVIPFEGKEVRKIWHKEEWYFSIIDVIEILTETDRPRKYWNDLKKKLFAEGYIETSEKIGQLKMAANDGKQRLTDCANTKGMFRIIMSVPSPKAESFRLWLAQVGEERLQEIENPELAVERARDIYKAKGYSDEWIERRLKSIEVRKELTDEWKDRGVKEGQEYAILTAEMAKATFGVTPSEHKKLKSLDKENLRDHMTNLELIFTMLGEDVTRRVAVTKDAVGFNENLDAAQKGGQAAGEARERVEAVSGEKVVSTDNFLAQIAAAEQKNALLIDSETTHKTSK